MVRFGLASTLLLALWCIASACGTGVNTTSQAAVLGSTRVGLQDSLNDRVFLGLAGDTLSALRLSDPEWEERLDEEAFYILRKNGTERAFTSPLNKEKRTGTFVCAACELPLFASSTKFDSGTGWPSFYEPVRDDHILEVADKSYGMVRVEVRCARCDGHQGHVFTDGPQPTGLRYCINGDALTFVE